MNPLALGAMSTSFSFGWLLVALVALVFLVRIYQRTGMSGFLWLLMAVVVWPTISRLSTVFLPFLIANRHESATSAAEFSIILFGVESLLGAALLLTAVVVLDRQFAARTLLPPVTTPGIPPYQV